MLHVALGELDPGDPTPLHRQLFHRLRDAILSGQLPARSRLPSTRALHIGLGISRNTAIEALSQLAAEGYVSTVRGSGTFVASSPPELHVRETGAQHAAGGPPRGAALGLAPGESKRGSRLRVLVGRLGAPSVDKPQPFALGPGLLQFPTRSWRAALLQVPDTVRARVPQPAGEPELRRALCQHLRKTRGLICTSEQVFVTRGRNAALALIVQQVADPHDRVFVEHPGPVHLRVVLEANGLRVTLVDVDSEGMAVGRTSHGASAARIMVVRPSCQFPLGVIMSSARRRQLLQFARDVNAWVLEDDSGSAYQYEGGPLTSIQGIDNDGRVIYLGTLDETLFPLVQFAYCVVPPSLVETFAAVVALHDPPGTVTEQLALAALIHEGELDAVSRRLRSANRARRDALLAALEPMPLGTSTQDIKAGSHALIWLRDDDARAATDAALAGVRAERLSTLYVRRARQGLLLGYAAYTPDAIRCAGQELRRVLNHAPARS